MLKKQQDEPGECRITTVLFDNEYEILHDRIDIKAVSPISEREYFVRGQTALLDAVGKTINKIGNAQKNTAKVYRAGKVLFVITTDGLENASREYSYDKIKSMVKRQRSKYGWEFIFLGANIDAVEAADRFGIARNRAQSFHNDCDGIALNYQVVSQTVAAFRETLVGTPISDNWNFEINKDFERRSVRR